MSIFGNYLSFSLVYSLYHFVSVIVFENAVTKRAFRSWKEFKSLLPQKKALCAKYIAWYAGFLFAIILYKRDLYQLYQFVSERFCEKRHPKMDKTMNINV